MTSGKACQERRVCQVSGSRAVDKKGCPDSDIVRSKPDQETVASSNEDVENSEMSKTKTSQRSRSRRPCQLGCQRLFPKALPCLYRFFPLSETSVTRLARALLVATQSVRKPGGSKTCAPGDLRRADQCMQGVQAELLQSQFGITHIEISRMGKVLAGYFVGARP